MHGRKKKVEGIFFFKTATENLFDRGREESEGESREREPFWMGRQICAHGTTLHPCYLSLPPDKQQYTTAGCCLSVMTTIVQISGSSRAQSLWLLALDSGSVFHSSRETGLSICHYIPI